jgi:hypothetical protein
MASRGGLSGLALAEIAAGILLAWSGIENASLVASLQSLIGGRKPAPDTGTEAVTSSTSGGTGGTADGPATAPAAEYISPAQAYTALRGAGLGAAAAVILTAIGGAESDWNLNALNNDPATGDYSVGVWQVNYYGDLMAARTAEFGPPAALLGDLAAQAAAAAEIWNTQGPTAWSTYTSGAFAGFLGQAQSAAGTAA